MDLSDRSAQLKKITVLVGGLFLLETVLVMRVSIPWLLGQVNADDFYYYLVLAKNSATGLGPTFDGLAITNGFHPLYLMLLIPFASLPIQSPVFLIKLSLIILLLFHNLTGLTLFLGFQRQQQQNLGWLVAILWLTNPWLLAITLHGVEAPIATFLWALTLFQVRAIRHQNTPPQESTSTISLGVLLGLTILARTDGVFLVGAITLAELYRLLRNQVGWLAKLSHLALLNGCVLLVTLPWWWWNWQNFGTLLQVSGQAIFLNSHGFNWQRLDILVPHIGMATALYFGRFFFYNLPLALVLLLALWHKHYQKTASLKQALAQVLHEFDFAVLAILGLAVWYAGWQWHIQNWYLLSSSLIATIIISVMLERSEQLRTQWATTRFIVGVIFVNFLIVIGVYTTFGFGFPNQVRGYHIAQWLNQHTPPTSRVGAWNSGIIGYFSQNPVINLDGVVNNGLYEYKRTHRPQHVGALMDYVRQQEITYLTDYEFLYFADPTALGLREIYHSPEYGFRVYQRDN